MRRTRCFLQNGSRSLEVTETEWVVVGRDPECDLVVRDQAASRRHCRFVLDAGRARVVDLQSKNGVRLNGELIRGAREVRDGDVVVIGTSRISIHERAAPPRAAEPLPLFDESSDESTVDGPKAIEVFARGAREGLATSDLILADSNTRTLLLLIRRQAKRGSAVPDGVARETLRIVFDLAEALEDRAWLIEATELRRWLDLQLTPEEEARYRALSEALPRTSPPDSL